MNAKAHPKDPQADLELTFSDLVQLVRKEYSNERDNISYVRAAKIVDKAIEPQFQAREQQLLTELLGELPEDAETYLRKRKLHDYELVAGDNKKAEDYGEWAGWNEYRDQCRQIINRKIGELNG